MNPDQTHLETAGAELTAESPVVEYALRYAAAGFRVIPLHEAHDGRCTCGHADCESAAKHPRTPHGAHDGSRDPAVIRAWWRRWPDANLGLVLDGLVVIDIDPRNGGDADLLPDRLPDTCFAKTGGGGWHYLYRAREGASYPGSLAAGIDVKHGPGAYIVVEPSVHASGEHYSFLDESEPWSMQPAEAPAWLERVNGAQHEAGTGNAFGDPLRVADLLANVMRAVSLHDSLMRLAAHYAAQGLTFKQVCELLEAPMLAASVEHDTRWQARYAEIPRLVQSALKKFQTAAERDDALRVEHLPENWQETRPAARPYILYPYIPRRAVSALIGAGTASKTLLVCEWVLAIITGTGWRQHPVLHGGGDIVILTWEDETADYHAKLHSLLHYARQDLLPYADVIRQRLHIVPMHGSKHRLVGVDERGRPAPTMLPRRVVDLVRAEYPATASLFIETVSRSNAADESNEALANFVGAGEIIAQELNSGVTAVHHVSKLAAVNGIVDAHAGRGGSALVDNSRASTVVALLNADMPWSLWPPGFTAADFTDREIVLIENARSSYARKAERVHLERIYPDLGAPYLRALRVPMADDPDAPKRDPDAEKLLAWMQDERRAGQWLAEREIVKRFKEYGLTERAAGNALARAREGGSVVWKDEKQYRDKGRMVTRYRLAGACGK